MSTKSIVSVTKSTGTTLESLQKNLTVDNAAESIVEGVSLGASVAEFLHSVIALLITTFGKKAVMGFHANKKTPESKHKFATELEITDEQFLQLEEIVKKTKASRRADSWQQAKNCYISFQNRLDNAEKDKDVVAVQDKSKKLDDLEMKALEVKATVAAGKAAHRKAEKELLAARCGDADEATIADLTSAATMQKAAYTKAEKELDGLKEKLAAERAKAKAEKLENDFQTKLEALTDWCEANGMEYRIEALKATLRLTKPETK